MIKKSFYIIICFFIMNIFVHCNQRTKSPVKQQSVFNNKDSILTLLQLTKDKKGIEVIKYAKKALLLSEKSKNDSLWYLSLNRLSILNYKYGFYLKFKKNSELYLAKATVNKDTIQLAKGNYKMGSYFLKTTVYDSAYSYFNTAKEFFRKQNDSLQVTANLLNMAIIQNRAGDYNGSEITAVNALAFTSAHNSKYLLSLYNNLGNTSNELEQYPNAIHWYKESLANIKKEKQKIIVLNNIGNTYSKQKKYTTALSYLHKAINNPKISKYPSIKAMVLDNIGYVHFLNKNDKSLSILKQAYNIRQKQHDKRGEIVSQLHLGEWYLSQKNKKKAIKLFNLALDNAIAIKDLKNKLKALLLLSKITAQNNYIYDYAFLNDSINKSQKRLKNQFAKIKYRTKQQETQHLILQQKYTNQSHRLEIQQNKKMRLTIISLGLLAILIAFLFYYRQKQRLQKQQLIIEKLNARTEENQSISMHLHDDIASDLLISLQRADQLQQDIKDKELEHIISFIDSAYHKMRTISQRLNIQTFKHISFEKKMDKLCHEYSFKADIKIIPLGLETIPWNRFNDEIKRTIYSIIQEAFTNVLKHAKATKTTVEFTLFKKELHISIKDNGVGYSASFKKGIGLLNMEHRVKEMQGTFSINDLQPKGTEIKIILPKI